MRGHSCLSALLLFSCVYMNCALGQPGAALPALLKVEGKLAATDPRDRVRTQSHHHVHPVKVEVEASYTIDLESKDFDSYLRLEDGAGKELAQDDDGGGNRNARLRFKATRTDTYRIIVTTFAPNVTGAYTLTVRKTGGLSPEQQAQFKALESYQSQTLQLRKAGKLNEATAVAEKTLTLEELLRGPEHADVVATLLLLAELNLEQARLPEARRRVQQALAIRKKNPGATPPSFAASLVSLGQQLAKQGDPTTADSLLTLAASIQKFEPGTGYFDTLKALLAVRKQQGEKQPAFQQTLTELVVASGRSAGLLARKEPTAAQQLLGDLLGYLTEHHDKGHWQVAQLRMTLERLRRLGRHGEEGARNLQEANQLDHRVMLDYRRGHFSEARLAAQASLRMRKECPGEDHPDYALSLNNLGMLERALGEFQTAEEHLRQAWELRRRTLGHNHPETALTLNNLGQLHFDLGDYVQAEQCLSQSLAAFRLAVEPKHDAQLIALNNLAVLYQHMGDPDRAEPLLRQAYDHFLAGLKDSPEERKARAGYVSGLYHAMAGQTNWAGALYLELHYGEPARPEDVLLEVTFLNNLARVAGARGDPTQAEKQYRQALQMLAQAAESPQPALAALGNSQERAALLNNLGLLYLVQKKLEQAEDLLTTSLNLRKKRYGTQHPEYAVGLTSLAFLRLRQNQSGEAETLLTEAATLHQRSHGEHSFSHANALANLAVVLDQQGKAAEAAQLMRRALQDAHAQLLLMAAIQSERQQLAALTTFRGHLDTLVSLGLRGQLPPEQLAEPILRWKGMVFLRQQRLRERNWAQQPGREEASRLQRELDDLARQLGRLATSTGAAKSNEFRQTLERREQAERELAALVGTVQARREMEQRTAQELSAALPADVALVDFLEYQYLLPDSGKTGPRRAVHLLATVLRKDQPVRIRDLGPIQSLHKALESWRRTLQRDLPGTDQDNPAVRVRKAVWEPLEPWLQGCKTVLISPDGSLGNLPFAALPGQDPKKYLVEELGIALIPVPQALPTLLKRPVRANAREPSLLIVGDVDFGEALASPTTATVGLAVPRTAATGNRPHWAALPGTRGEMLTIRDTYEQKYPFPDGQLHVLRGTRATEANFRAHAAQHRWLHLATHGFFAPAGLGSALATVPLNQAKAGPSSRSGSAGFHPGLLSGLVLAGANRPLVTGQDDGVLSALEVAELDLANVELAVLSACETGLGTAVSGEGLLGLQRAFQVAGARTVVASLWQVDDQATRKLMEQFYEHLWKQGLSPLEALRQAQLWMLREGTRRGMVRQDAEKQLPQRAPPYYWAAFVLSGDWR